MENFNLIGVVDVSSVKKLMSFSDKLFADNDFRQRHVLSPHRDTETIFLRWPVFTGNFLKDLQNAMLNVPSIEHEPMCIPPFFTLVDQVENVLGRAVERAIVVRLKVGGTITPHIDEGEFADSTERYHIPIEAHPGSVAIVEDEIVSMQEGEVWWFDKHKLHSFSNKSLKPRTHLIVDVLK